MPHASRPEITGTYGVVTSTHWAATQCGMAVLEDGGNAFDAAVAVATVLQVVEPHLNGPGGDLSLIFRPAGGEAVVLCGQGPAPAAATIEAMTGLGMQSVPGTGLLAATVPGAMPAWLTLLRDHGTKSVGEVLRFAAGYAADGFPILERASRTIAAMAPFFAEHWPGSAELWLPAPAAGARHHNPALARTYARLIEAAAAAPTRDSGCDASLTAWSQGFVAEAVDAHTVQSFRDSSGADHPGLLRAQDLGGWRPGYEQPRTLEWRGWRLAKCGGWSQGPAFLASLALLDPLLPDRIDPLDAELIHLIVEAQKLAFADRDAWYGDGATAADLDALMDPARLAERRGLIGTEASHELRPGPLGDRPGRLPTPVRAAKPAGAPRPAAGTGEPTQDLGRGDSAVRASNLGGGDTCHLDVADRWGNVVSATPSGGWLQASPTIPELGFCLGTRLQMVWLEPGFASSLRPGRRPRTTLSPSLAIDDADRTLGFGTPGGDQQDQWSLQFWLEYTLGGRDLQEAVDAPKFHSTALVSSFAPRTWAPAGLEIEDRFGDGVLHDLLSRGHAVTVRDGWSLGRITAALHDPATATLRAAADPRSRQAYAAGR